MQEHHITVERTARYFILGEMNDSVKEVWFACHGQGQLASYFLKSFIPLANSERLIVVPEALSRFYIDNLGSRVGAIWMTREDRLSEIRDYVNYLNKLDEKIFEQIDRKKVKVIALGFSQGVATVCRWINASVAKADRLILWAGQLPAELDKEGNWEIFQNMEVFLVIGDKDEYADWTLIDEQEAILKRHDLKYQKLTFDGKHEINSDLLQEIAKTSIAGCNLSYPSPVKF
jgi:predicted esterase